MSTQVETTPYEEHRDSVLGVLARRCGWLGFDEREAVFHDAYAMMLEKQRDGSLDPDEMHPKQLRAYLTQAAINKALDEGKRAERKRTEPLGEGALEQPDPTPRAAPDEVVNRHVDGARLREIVGDLPARRQAVVKLRFFFDRSPEEIQRALAISPRAYRRDLERGLRYVSECYQLVQEGSFCETRKDAILAYVAGTADENSGRQARDHLSNCPACARYVIAVREAARDVAAVLPIPALAVLGESTGRFAEAGATLRGGLTDWIASAKQHVASLALRLDPSAASHATGVGPGATVAAVTGCIAAAGGAAYCVTEGIPGSVGSSPFQGAERGAVERTDAAKEPHHTDPPAIPIEVRRPPAPPPPAEPSSPQTKSAPPAEPEPAPTPAAPTPAAPTPAAAPADTEFGLEGAATPAAPSSGGGGSSDGGSSSGGGGSSSGGPTGEFDP